MSSTDSKNINKEEEISEGEAKLRAKFGNLKPKTTDFLQKRLQKGVKYFDSGDYNMSKPSKANQLPIATPDNLPRKKPTVPSKLAAAATQD